MSGHNKWSKIQHKKGAADAARGQAFTKVIREIMVAAKQGGSDVDHNARLRSAVLAAKDINMPKDNIDRAIKKGAGELEGVVYSEVTYEGYGPGGVALVVDCLTDNKNRTVAEIRHIFTKCGGNMAQSGAVSYMFKQKGVLEVEKAKTTEDVLMEKALENGALDIVDDGDIWTVYCEPTHYLGLRQVLTEAGIEVANGEVSKIPDTKTLQEGDVAKQVLKVIDRFEECDDVQKVYTNADFSDETLEGYEG